jgi:hypothetical protein
MATLPKSDPNGANAAGAEEAMGDLREIQGI